MTRNYIRVYIMMMYYALVGTAMYTEASNSFDNGNISIGIIFMVLFIISLAAEVRLYIDYYREVVVGFLRSFKKMKDDF